MILNDFLDRLEAIRLHQQKLTMNDKPSPKVYEQLLALPVNECMHLMHQVDEQLERDAVATTVDKLKAGLKDFVTKK